MKKYEKFKGIYKEFLGNMNKVKDNIKGEDIF